MTSPLPGHKIFVIELPRGLPLEESLSKRDALGKSIGAIVKNVNTPVFFHDYKGPVGGMPQILLECPVAVIDLIRNLSGIGRIHEIYPGTETERSPKLWDYFTGTSVKPAVSKRPKPPKSFKL